MIFPDGSPDDLLNPVLKREALAAQERGEGFAVWHGRDTFTGGDVEFYLNLDTLRGAVAFGRNQVFPGRITEDGPHVTLIFGDTRRGAMNFDLDSEELEMDHRRVGVDYGNDGVGAHLRLYDRLTGDTIHEVGDDSLHELVNARILDPKDFAGTGLTYVKGLGLV